MLLLDHQPRGLKENKKVGVDLSLSGHTHAGQIWPTGQLGELIGVTELNYGYRQDHNYQVIVSSGIGGWGMYLHRSALIHLHRDLKTLALLLLF